MTDNKMGDALALVPAKYASEVSWGDRGGGRHWQSRVGPFSTIGNGGPYATAHEAIAAAVGLSRDNLTTKGE